MHVFHRRLLQTLLQLSERRNQLEGAALDELKAKFMMITSSEAGTLELLDRWQYRAVPEDPSTSASGERRGLIVPGCGLTLSQFLVTLRALDVSGREEVSFYQDDLLAGVQVLETITRAFEWSELECEQETHLQPQSLTKHIAEAQQSLAHYRNTRELPRTFAPARAYRRHLIDRLIQLAESRTLLTGEALDELKAVMLLATAPNAGLLAHIDGIKYGPVQVSAERPEDGERSGLLLGDSDLTLETFVNELCWDLPPAAVTHLPFSHSDYQSGLLAVLALTISLDWSTNDARIPADTDPDMELSSFMGSLAKYRVTGEP